MLCLQVDIAIQDGAGKTKFDTQDFRLKPQKTLFGYDSTEKIEGWVCRIFEANGRMTAMEHLKVHCCSLTHSEMTLEGAHRTPHVCYGLRSTKVARCIAVCVHMQAYL